MSFKILLLVAPTSISVVVLLSGCGLFADSFFTKVSPSGIPCSDLPVIANGDVVGREFHRVGAVASAWKATSEGERVESLRRAACRKGGDGIVEVISEEVRDPRTGMFVERFDGEAVQFLRPRTKGGDMADTAADVNARIARPRFPQRGGAPASTGSPLFNAPVIGPAPGK